MNSDRRSLGRTRATLISGVLAAAVAIGGASVHATRQTNPVPPSTTAVPPSTSVVPPATTVVPPPTTVVPPPTTVVPPATTVVPPPTTAASAVISAEAIRAAKVGWSRFVADNFAVPTAVPDPCPLLAADDAAAQVQALGLVASALPYSASLYRDATGTGIVVIACGVDLSAGADPAGSTGFVVEATLLDGQAVFPQYVVRVAGQNTPIGQSPELGGDVIGRCRNQPSVCVASWHSAGLIVTVRLDGPRTDQSEAQVRQSLLTVVRQAVANLAAVAPPSLRSPATQAGAGRSFAGAQSLASDQVFSRDRQPHHI